MKQYLLLSVSVAGVFSAALRLMAADPARDEPVSFHRQIRPILQQKCQGCHQPAKARGGLILTGYEPAAKGGDAGALWAAGKPQQSLVVNYLKGLAGLKRMPENEPPLPDQQIALFEKWIRQGARDDTPEQFKKTLVVKGPPSYTQPVMVTALAHSPDGSTLAVAGYREVLLHKSPPAPGSGEGLSGALLGRLVGLSERIESVVFSPDGELLLVGGGSAGRFGEIQLWDWKKQKLERSVFPSFDTVYGASFSADGKLIAVGCADNSVRLIETASGKQVRRIDHHLDWVFGTAFTLNGKSIITASRDRTVKLCEVDSGAFIGNVTTLDPTQPSSGMRNLLRRPRADQFLAGGEDGVPRLYGTAVSAGGNQIRTYGKLPGKVEAAAFSADGAMLAAGGAGGVVLVYGTDSGQQSARLSVPGTVFAISFQPDGKAIAVAGLEGKVHLFTLPEGKPLKDFVPVPIGVAAK